MKQASTPCSAAVASKLSSESLRDARDATAT
jgi:hypothetical protein